MPLVLLCDFGIIKAMRNGKEPATKQDLLDLEARLEAKFMEALRDIETKLLRAFFSFAESNQKRLSEVERSHSSMQEWMAIVDRRLLEVERRLNFPNYKDPTP